MNIIYIEIESDQTVYLEFLYNGSFKAGRFWNCSVNIDPYSCTFAMITSIRVTHTFRLSKYGYCTY